MLEKYAISGTTSALGVVNIVIPPAVEHTITVTVATEQGIYRHETNATFRVFSAYVDPPPQKKNKYIYIYNKLHLMLKYYTKSPSHPPPPPQYQFGEV